MLAGLVILTQNVLLPSLYCTLKMEYYLSQAKVMLDDLLGRNPSSIIWLWFSGRLESRFSFNFYKNHIDV